MPSEKRNPRIRPVFKTSAIDDQVKFQPLPAPTGEYPFRLDIENVIPGIDPQKYAFHVVGDTGSLRSINFQRSVADMMSQQYHENTEESDKPKFLFHLGDVVYNFGQASKYYDQFFSVYKNYRGPVFAIPGNHDSDVDPLDEEKLQSLDAFRAVFCDTEQRSIELAGDTNRKTNTQPNIYWTLQTPLANIIGLYSNVPKFGTITDEQKAWFINELKVQSSAANKKALVVCIHHSPYSADINHGSSLHMQQFLNEAFSAANVLPDIVFSGHVHNYQRFNKTYPNGKVVPFVVAGAGGFSDLHAIADPHDPDFPDNSPLLDHIELQNYCDDTHGFLKLSLERTKDGISLTGDYYIAGNNEQTGAEIKPYDSFSLLVK
jgi:predicted phosphodiesterase